MSLIICDFDLHSPPEVCSCPLHSLLVVLPESLSHLILSCSIPLLCFPPQHEAARRLTGDWANLTTQGTLSRRLVDVLWQAHSPDRRGALLQLMIRFGLAAAKGHNNYLIPALLPEMPATNTMMIPCALECFLSVSIAAVNAPSPSPPPGSAVLPTPSTTPSPSAASAGAAAPGDCVGALEAIGGSGFLPSGMFGRFLAHCVRWSGSTTIGFTPTLWKNAAVLAFGDTLFTLTELPKVNSIRVGLPSNTNPEPVLERVRDLLKGVMADHYDQLCHTVLVPVPDSAVIGPTVLTPATVQSSPPTPTTTTTPTTVNPRTRLSGSTTTTAGGGGGTAANLPITPGTVEGQLVVDLDAVREVMAREEGLWVGTIHIPHSSVYALFCHWLPSMGLRPAYDLFFSYRWVNAVPAFHHHLTPSIPHDTLSY